MLVASDLAAVAIMVMMTALVVVGVLGLFVSGAMRSAAFVEQHSSS